MAVYIWACCIWTWQSRYKSCNDHDLRSLNQQHKRKNKRLIQAMNKTKQEKLKETPTHSTHHSASSCHSRLSGSLSSTKPDLWKPTDVDDERNLGKTWQANDQWFFNKNSCQVSKTDKRIILINPAGCYQMWNEVNNFFLLSGVGQWLVKSSRFLTRSKNAPFQTAQIFHCIWIYKVLNRLNINTITCFNS